MCSVRFAQVDLDWQFAVRAHVRSAYDLSACPHGLNPDHITVIEKQRHTGKVIITDLNSLRRGLGNISRRVPIYTDKRPTMEQRLTHRSRRYVHRGHAIRWDLHVLADDLNHTRHVPNFDYLRLMRLFVVG